MGHQCCIPGCSTNGRHGSKVGVTFHSFPVDPVERKQWLESVKKLDLQKLSVTKHTKVCSKHFRTEDFVALHSGKRRLLKKGVFPSIFTAVSKNAQARKEISSPATENVTDTESSGKDKSSSALPSQEDEGDYDEQKDSSGNLDNEQNSSRAVDGQECSMDDSASMDQVLKGDASCDFSGRSEDYDQGNMSDTTHTSSPSDSNMGSPSKKSGSGLSFHIGSRLEAKDLGNEVWYPVKIVEVDWEDEEVLIHFEKWSQRYDEWVPMDSSRLRPSQNPVAQNEGKSSVKVFKVGDKVMATWSDSRRYPAKVSAVLDNDKYEVLFFDGYTKTIKGARMTKIEDSKTKVETEVPKEEVTPAVKEESKQLFTSHPTFTKEERRERKRKINVVELFHPKKRIRLGNETPNRSEPEEEKPKEVQKRRRSKLSPHKVNDVEEQSEESSCTVLDSNASKIESPQASETSNAENAKKKNKDVHKWKMKVKARVRRGDFGSRLRRGSSNLKQEEDLARSKTLEHNSNGKKLFKKSTNLEQETPSSAVKSRRESNDSMTLEPSVLGAVEGREPVEEKKEASDILPTQEKKNDAAESAQDTDKWAADGENSVTESGDGDRKTIVIPDSNLPNGWSKHTVQRKHGSSAGKWDVILVNSEGRKFRTRSDIKQYFEEKGESYNPDRFDFCVSGKKRLHRAPDFNSRKVSRLSGSRGRLLLEPGNESVEKPQQQVLRRVKTLLPKIRMNSGQPLTEEEPGSKLEPLSPPPPYTTTVASVPAELEMAEPEGQVIVGGLKIQMENNTYKCPKGGCGKNFRKENLLQMHIKHYHPEYNKFMGSTPNVADLAYARTIGESIEDLMPKPRFSGGSTASATTTPFTEKANRMEPSRKIKTAGGISGVSSNCNSSMNATDTALISEKKKLEPKDKQPGAAVGKKPAKRSFHENENRMLGEESVSTSEEPQDEKSNITDTKEVVSSASPEMPVLHKEEKKEVHTIKTLMPVIRSPPQETSPAERIKAKAPAEEGEEYVEVMDVGSRQASTLYPANSTVHGATQLPNMQSITSTTAVTKSLRPVKKRHLSDFHFEPIHKRRKIATKLDVSDEIDVTDEAEASVDITSTTPLSTAVIKTTPTTYRYSKKKTPVVHLEKLNIVTDSNGRVILSSMKVQGQRKLNKNTDQPGFEQLRKEELINCTCGFMEEDGLMIQCDLCLCWQHGICNNIEKETEVPEKYVCPICLNPFRQRKSKKYLHDQDWLKEGKLPSLSFRSKNETTIAEREAILKRSHDLTGSLLQIQQVLHSLRVKVNIAGIPDHPKLYLWAKSWEKDNDNTSRLPGTAECENRPSCFQSGSEKQKPVIVESCRPEILNSKAKSDAESTEAKLQTEENKDEQFSSPVTSLECNRTDKDVRENKGFAEVANISNVANPFAAAAADAGEVRNALSSCQTLTDEQADNSLSAECKNNTKADGKETPEINAQAGAEDESNLSSLGSTEGNKEKVESLKHSEEIAVAMEEVVLAQEEKKCNLSEQVLHLSSNSSEQNIQKNETEEAPSEKSEATENNTNVSKTIETEEIRKSAQKPEEVTHLLEEQVNCIEADKVHEQNKVDKQDKILNKEDDLSNQTESHGLLHQALTNGSQISNSLTNGVTGGNLDGTSGHSMLQLPICQSELMQFASTMADNLNVTETPRPPSNEAPRIPQPEAPIDPVECRLFLLDHIDHFQAQIDTRLTMLEEQVAALESQDPDTATDEAPDYFPQTKQTVQMLLRDLLTMRRIAALN